VIKKNVVIFGAGKYFENYIKTRESEEKPVFIVDNDEKKVGKYIYGIEIKSPSCLLEMPKETFYVVVCSAYYKQIAGQLEEMGITDYQPHKFIDSGSLNLINANEKRELYGVGYVPGVFDLFHVGHLNLIRNSKSRCKYLIVGVLTDELVKHFKGNLPNIPYTQRATIIEAIKYVDRVVPVDFDNTVKIDAWHKYHFDCHFSGNDHGKDWEKDLKQLKSVGSNMEFFQYTLSTSSTKIRQLLNN